MTDEPDDQAVSTETSGGRVPEAGDPATPREAHDRVAPEVRKLRHGDNIPQRDTPQPDV
jgi:hypothetical protein